jgi:hypothetical protein
VSQSGRYLPPQANGYHAGNSHGGPPFLGPQVTNTRRPVNSVEALGVGVQTGEHIDRHAFVYRGTEIAGRISGLKDPQEDGPTRPSIRLMLRQWMMWQGSDATRNFDPPRAYKQYGRQAGTDTVLNGGQVGYYLPYGQRSTLSTVPGNTGAQSRSVLLGGPPHGLHTHTPTPRLRTMQIYEDTPQMMGPRQSRLSNSNRNGQNYSMRTKHQGAGG